MSPPDEELDGSPMTWTDERVETLKTMWSDGKSASQIAKELGGVTRNAVIGKVHRLGLSNRVGAERPDDDFAPEPVSAAAPAAKAAGLTGAVAGTAPLVEPPRAADPAAESEADEPAAPRPRPSLAPVPAQPAPAPPVPSEISPEALANLAEVERKARRLTLMQLTERTCKWPVGDPATDDFWFCGLPSVAGKPYCEAHVAVAFQPMSSRRDRRAGGR
jgi:GcrA cell cycle regulator